MSYGLNEVLVASETFGGMLLCKNPTRSRNATVLRQPLVDTTQPIAEQNVSFAMQSLVRNEARR